MWRVCSRAGVSSTHSRKYGKNSRPGPPVNDDRVERDLTAGAPNLLAARPELGRAQAAPARKIIRALSRRGILLGAVDSAGLPAVMAATDLSALGGAFYGSSGPGNLGGPRADQKPCPTFRTVEEAQRVRGVLERLTQTAFVTT